MQSHENTLLIYWRKNRRDNKIRMLVTALRYPEMSENSTYREIEKIYDSPSSSRRSPSKIIQCFVCGKNRALGCKLNVQASPGQIDPSDGNSCSAASRKNIRRKMVTKAGTAVSHAHFPHGGNINNTCELDIIIDSRAPEHLEQDVSLLTNEKTVSAATAVSPNGSHMTAEKCGTFIMDIGNGNVVSPRGYYIENLTLNLLSCSRLDEYGIAVACSNQYYMYKD